MYSHQQNKGPSVSPRSHSLPGLLAVSQAVPTLREERREGPAQAYLSVVNVKPMNGKCSPEKPV